MTTRNARRMCGLWSAGAAAVLIAIAGGCDDATPLSQAINQANIKLTALAPGGVAPATPKHKEQVYGEVAALLSKSADGTDGEKALAQLLLSQAQLGLADGPVAHAAATERQSLSVLTRLNSTLALWRNHNAVASAAQKFDPNPEVAEIDAANQEKDAAILQENGRRAQVDSRVAQLKNEAAALMAQARDKQAQSAKLVAQIPNETAVRGEQLLREARDIARDADTLEARAAELEAQAAQIAPQADEIQLSIDRLNNQKTLLAKAREEVAQRAAWHADQARQARAEAEKAAQEADALVQELVETRERAGDSGSKPYEQAVSALERAATTASGVREPSLRGNGLLITGAARQALGDLHWTHAHGLARAAEAMTAVANAVPPLPNSARYKDVLAQLQEQQKTALEAATAAYQGAVEAYGQAGAQGDARERLDRVQQKIARIVKVTSGGTVDLMAQLGGAGDGGSEGGDDAAPIVDNAEVVADQSTVRGTIQLFVHASNARDFDALAALFHTPTDAHQQAVASLIEIGKGIDRLDAACKAKFGEGLEGARDVLGEGQLNLDGFADFSIEDVEITEDGDRATISPAAGLPQTLVRVDGVWKFEFPITGDAQMAGQFASVMATMMDTVVKTLVSDIEAGMFSSVGEVAQAFKERTSFGSGGPPGGGGG